MNLATVDALGVTTIHWQYFQYSCQLFITTIFQVSFLNKSIMKKLHFSLLAILFALVATMTFTACSSDDDAPSTEDIKTNIVGLWQTTHVSGWTYDDTEKLIKVDQDIADKSDEAQRILFTKSGNCCVYNYSTYRNNWESLPELYSYDVSGNKIIVYYNSTIVEQTYTVISLKDDVVVLQYCMDEGDSYKTTITAKRVY